MAFVANVGAGALGLYRRFRHLAAVAWGALTLAVTPSSWRAPVRAVLARQIVFTGYDAIGFVSVIAVLVGVSIVVQAQLWMGRFGRSEFLGALLVTVVVREVGPLLVNFIVIGRSGTAMAAELAGMRMRREVEVLDAQGIDPMVYLIMPRVIAMPLCVLGLTVFFVVVALGSGYVCGALLGTGPGDPSIFARNLIAGTVPSDFVMLLCKTLIPGLFTATICAIEAFSIEGLATDIPQAVTRSVVRSNAAVLVVSVIISLLAYT